MACRAALRRCEELVRQRVLDSSSAASAVLQGCRGVSSGSTSGSLKRFYKEATVLEAKGMPGHWNVMLDGRKVKTPNHDTLLVPSHSLACAIASEFQYQSSDYIRPITQPLYRLQWQVQLASFNRQELVDKMLHYVDSDPVCMRSPVDSLSRKLEQLQESTFGSIQNWANDHFGITLATSKSLYGSEQHPEVPLAYAAYLNKLPYPQLVALSELAGACKSLLIAFALYGQHITVDEAVAASRIEEDVQMEQFGMVEGGHDLDIADLRTRVGGCALYMQMLDLDGVLGLDHSQVQKDVGQAMKNLASLGF